MHATPSAIAGSAPAQSAGPLAPVRPGRRLSRRCFGRTASLAAVVLALTAVLGLAYGAGGADASGTDGSGTTPNQGRDRGPIPRMAALTVDDLPSTLNLSTAQRAQLTAALAELRHDRSVIGRRFGAGGRGPGHHNAGYRWHRNPGPRTWMHRGAGPGWCNEPGHHFGMGPGNGPSRHFGRNRGDRPAGDQWRGRGDGPRRGRGAGFEPPMIGLLDRASSILDSDQFVILAKFLAGRHAEMRLTLEQKAPEALTPQHWAQTRTFREGREDRRLDRPAEALPRRVDRVTAMYIRVLDLEDAQASQVRRIMEATIPAHRAVAERGAQGTLEPEGCAHEMMTIEKTAAEQVRGVLTPDQAKRFDALLDLLPRKRR